MPFRSDRQRPSQPSAQFELPIPSPDRAFESLMVPRPCIGSRFRTRFEGRCEIGRDAIDRARRSETRPASDTGSAPRSLRDARSAPPAPPCSAIAAPAVHAARAQVFLPISDLLLDNESITYLRVRRNRSYTSHLNLEKSGK